MVKRRDKIAILQYSIGSVINGKWQDGEAVECELNGRFVPSQNSNASWVLASSGDRINFAGYFITNSRKITDTGYLVIDEVKYKILHWLDYQSFSKIELEAV